MSRKNIIILPLRVIMGNTVPGSPKVIFIHPAIQISAILLSFPVMHLGIRRAAYNHFGREKRFNRKRHVLMGRVVFLLLFTGIATGLFVTGINWKSYLISGIHGYTGILIALLVIIGFYSGTMLASRKSSSAQMIILHGINNGVLLLLLFFQIYSGYKFYMTFVINF